MAMTPPPKKGKGGLIALIVALVLVIAGGLGGWYGVSNWSIKTMSIAFAGSGTSLTLNVGDSKTGTVTITPAKPLHDSYTYTSSNNSVLSVTQDGATITVKALKPGSASITGTTANSAGQSKPVTTRTDVTVLLPATDIQGLPDSIEIEEGGAAQITASVVPDGSTDRLRYSIDDESVATIDSISGIVTGVVAGSATLTVTAGSVTKTVPITVTAPITWNRASAPEVVLPANSSGRPWLPSRPVHNCTGFSLFFTLLSVDPAAYASDLENIDWIVWAYGPHGWQNVATFHNGSVASIYTGDVTFPAMDITKLFFSPSNAPSRLNGWSIYALIEGTKTG